MRLHRNCVTDPQAKALWRDYQKVCSEGNPLGLSFVEYIAQRITANAPRTASNALPSSVPWYVAECGHQHPWGLPCSVWTSAQ